MNTRNFGFFVLFLSLSIAFIFPSRLSSATPNWVGEDFFLLYEKKMQLYRDNELENTNTSLSKAIFQYSSTKDIYYLQHDYYTGTYFPEWTPTILHIMANLTINLSSRKIIFSEIDPDYLNYTGRSTLFWISSGSQLGDVIPLGAITGRVINETEKEIMNTKREHYTLVINHSTSDSHLIGLYNYDKETLLLTSFNQTTKIYRYRMGIMYEIKIKSQMHLINTSLTFLTEIPNDFSSDGVVFPIWIPIFSLGILTAREIKRKNLI